MKEKGPEPIRKGDFVVDIDCKGDPIKGIEVTRRLVRKLIHKYGVPQEFIHCWLSGGKGCHVIIPAIHFGAEHGDPYLPKIYKGVVRSILKLIDIETQPYFDMGMYSMGRGRLLRCANILRPNGKYKVPITVGELLQMDLKELQSLTDKPRELPKSSLPKDTAPHVWLKNLFDLFKWLISSPRKKREPFLLLESLFKCKFMTHCANNAQSLSEPEWFAMIGLLLPFGEMGKKLIHVLSTPHPEYSYEDTEKKCLHAKQYINEKKYVSCRHIKSLFDCQQDCAVASPNDLWAIQRQKEYSIASGYIVNDDGLYLKGIAEEDEQSEPRLISSPIKVLRRVCAMDGKGWGRTVWVKNAAGDATLEFFMKDIAKTDIFLGELLDAGLEITDINLAKKHLPRYVLNAILPEQVTKSTKLLGWHDENYILPDVSFGLSEEVVEFQGNGSKHFHQCSGSLEEWQEHIGSLCKGNSLFVLMTSLALTGPVLKLCSEEGIGMNIYGTSSSGKTTCALVAGSVCGGGGRNGYIRSWRSTDNALEAIAAEHNDGLLVLDELGQAVGDSVGRTVYMLINGEAKNRMTSEAILRKTSQWRVNLLSTGELTIPQKIAESGKLKSMAGQEVRVIDLPIGGVNSQATFDNLHSHEGPGQLSQVLSERSKKYYGSPLRAFLKHLCENKEASTDSILEMSKTFEKQHLPEKSSGQVQRVCRKFSLIAATGELAIELGILPYDKGEAFDAAGRWFATWLDLRPGLGNLEVEKSIEAIFKSIELYGMTQFVELQNGDKNASNYHMPNYLGYRWEDGTNMVYFFLSTRFTEHCKGLSSDAVKEELRQREMLKLNKNGQVMETKSVSGQNFRGIGILIPLDTEKSKPSSPGSDILFN